jgi:DNA helicase-2/ATP-dependent DNA helicase PcrA
VLLNAAQRAAVDHVAGPLEIVAGPGTGKTRVLTERVVRLTTQLAVKPERILALTFTEKAAEEMGARIRLALTEAGVKGQPKVRTFHAFCLELIEDHPERVGFDGKPQLLVGPLYVQFIAENIDALVTDNTDLVGRTNLFAANVARFVSLCHDERLIRPDLVARVDAWIAKLPPKDHKAARRVRDLAASIEPLLAVQRKENVVSYGDLLTSAITLLEENEDVRAEVAGLFDHVLVDEYQDNNRAQSDLVRLLAGAHRNVCVVGDEDQSIYRFRGARSGIMSQFLSEWRADASQPRIITLEENYRSTPAIIDAGQVLIKHNSGRPNAKALRAALDSTASGPDRVRLARCDSASTERAYVIQEIRRLHREGRALGDMAILVRSLAHANMLIAEIRQAGIGLEVVGGGGLFSNPSVREVLAWLKALHDAEGEEVALHRLIRLQGFGLSHDDQRALGRAAREQRVTLMTLMHAVASGGHSVPHLSLQGVERVRGFVRIHDKFLLDERVDGRPDVTGLILEVLDMTGLGRWLSPDRVEDRQSLAALGGLLQAADNYQQHFPYPSLHGFVRHLDLLEELGHDDTVGEASNDAGVVKLMTVHQSKGREFPVVFVTNLQRYPPDNRREWDRKFLDHETLAGEDVERIHTEEERRVLFVALTRAKSELHVTLARSGDDGKAIEESPFEHDFDACAHLDARDLTARDIEPIGAAAGAYSTRREMEARLTFLVSRLGSHANGANVEQTLQECIRIVTGLLSEGAEGGVEAVERALKTIGIPLPPEVRYLEPDKPKGLTGPLYLSASSLNLYDGCPRQFYYKQVVRIPETSTFEARLGTAIHAALEEFHKRHAEPKVDQYDELIALFEAELADVQFAAEKEKQQASERGRTLLRVYLTEESARGAHVEMTEKEFTVALAEYVTLTGKIDRIDRLPDGRVRVIDYKSGRMKSRPEYLDDFQMPIYAWAVQDELGEKLESVEVIGLRELKETKNGPALDRAVLPWEDGSKYAITQERLAGVQERVRTIIDGIRAGRFDPTPEERRCGWCRYNLLCGSAYGVKPSDIERHP